MKMQPPKTAAQIVRDLGPKAVGDLDDEADE